MKNAVFTTPYWLYKQEKIIKQIKLTVAKEGPDRFSGILNIKIKMIKNFRIFQCYCSIEFEGTMVDFIFV